MPMMQTKDDALAANSEGSFTPDTSTVNVFSQGPSMEGYISAQCAMTHNSLTIDSEATAVANYYQFGTCISM
jgi:hypothetical protein